MGIQDKKPETLKEAIRNFQKELDELRGTIFKLLVPLVLWLNKKLERRNHGNTDSSRN